MHRSIKCEFCENIFEDQKALKIHQKTIHTFKGEKLQCEKCNKYYPDYTINKHIKTVHSEGKFKCDICNKAFHYEKSLSDHTTLYHNSGDTWKCELCLKEFSSVGSYNRHLKLVHV